MFAALSELAALFDVPIHGTLQNKASRDSNFTYLPSIDLFACYI